MDKELSVEVAYLINGAVASERRLSRRGEWRAGASAFLSVAALAAAAAAVVALALLAAHRIVYGPAYLAVWLVVGLGAAGLAARRAVRRARSFRVGAAIDDDAFSAVALPLVRVRLAATGWRWRPDSRAASKGDARRCPSRPSRARGSGGALPAGTRAELDLGAATFAIRVGCPTPDDAYASAGGRASSGAVGAPADRAGRAGQRPVRGAGRGAAQRVRHEVGHPCARHALGDREAHFALRPRRRRGRFTSASTSCRFPCQRSGYVGIGLALSRDGEIRSHWIARSTFGADCPVDQCMSDVIGTWYFEPLPESMKVILPVQVLRTDRPLPFGPARAAADVERNRLRAGID